MELLAPKRNAYHKHKEIAILAKAGFHSQETVFISFFLGGGTTSNYKILYDHGEHQRALKKKKGRECCEQSCRPDYVGFMVWTLKFLTLLDRRFYTESHPILDTGVKKKILSFQFLVKGQFCMRDCMRHVGFFYSISTLFHCAWVMCVSGTHMLRMLMCPWWSNLCGCARGMWICADNELCVCVCVRLCAYVHLCVCVWPYNYRCCIWYRTRSWSSGMFVVLYSLIIIIIR